MQLTTENDKRRSTRPALLHTAEGIAEYVGMPIAATRHLIRKGVFPTFRIGRTVCARPDRIDAALEKLEQMETADG